MGATPLPCPLPACTCAACATLHVPVPARRGRQRPAFAHSTRDSRSCTEVPRLVVSRGTPGRTYLCSTLTVQLPASALYAAGGPTGTLGAAVRFELRVRGSDKVVASSSGDGDEFGAGVDSHVCRALPVAVKTMKKGERAQLTIQPACEPPCPWRARARVGRRPCWACARKHAARRASALPCPYVGPLAA